MHNYFVTNFTYDDLSCAYIDLESLEETNDDINSRRLEQSRSKLKRFDDKITIEKAINNPEDVDLRTELNEKKENATTVKCILNKKSICCGTAKAMVMMLEAMNINAKYVVSKSDDLKINHAYVIAELEKGKWIKLDPTWDFGKINWEFFGFNELKGKYKDEEIYHTPQECDYSKYIDDDKYEFVSCHSNLINVLQNICAPKKSVISKVAEMFRSLG